MASSSTHTTVRLHPQTIDRLGRILTLLERAGQRTTRHALLRSMIESTAAQVEARLTAEVHQ